MKFTCEICGKTISEKDNISKVCHTNNGVIKAWCSGCIKKHYEKSENYHKSRYKPEVWNKV